MDTLVSIVLLPTTTLCLLSDGKANMLARTAIFRVHVLIMNGF
jgi:hypothetical protein